MSKYLSADLVNKIFAVMAVLLIGYLMTHGTAFASEGSGLPWESAFEKLRKSIHGPIATTGCVIGLVASLLGLLFGGNIEGVLKYVMMAVLIIAIVILADKFISSLTGSEGALIMDAAHLTPEQLAALTKL